MNNYQHGEGIKDKVEIAKIMENFIEYPVIKKLCL